MADVSVVVVTFRRPGDLAELERCLEKQTTPHELIIVDDSDTDYGLSNSRNVGIGKASGDPIIFLDDDTLCAPDLIARVLSSFENNKADIVGGYAQPLFLCDKPWWFDEGKFGWCFGVCNGDIIGACFAVKRKVFDEMGGFNKNLGRRHGSLLSLEESEFLDRAKARGFKAVFDKSITVNHKISTKRASIRYLVRRYWYEGKSQTIMY